MSEISVTTTSGSVRGMQLESTYRFLGIPYAAAPRGALRFAAPSPVASSERYYDARAAGPTAPQPDRGIDRLDLTPIDGPGWLQGEEFLSANVWTTSFSGGRPVMVFIHGGSFVGGCSDASAYDGSSFARSGVVFFAINYRLGIEGFAPVPGAPPNLGLRDQIAALNWIRDNARAFGGDPSNVTVFGQSAGGMAIAALISSPAAIGLFKRAIVQSGSAMMVRSRASTAPLIRRIAELLHVEPTLPGIRSAAIVDTIAATGALISSACVLPEHDGHDPGFGLSPFLPVWGDEVLPFEPMSAMRNGAGAGVDVLIGTTLEEANLFFVPGLLEPSAVAELLVATEPRAVEILAAYERALVRATSDSVLVQAMSDLVFRLPARSFAGAHQGKTHFYEFGWRSPACNGKLGACHGLDLPFVFNTLDSCIGPRGLLGSERPQELATEIHKLWIRFATHGTLPWPEYTSNDRKVFRLDTGFTVDDAEIPAEHYVGIGRR